MSKLITNDNLKAYHAELAEHIKLLQRGTAYSLNDIVNYDGKTLKCTTAGTTTTTKPDVSALDVGDTLPDGTAVWTRVDLDKRGIDYWASSTDYALNDQVVYNDKIYKCSTAHTSTSTFDGTKWTEISVSSGGGSIDEWTSGTSYSSGDLVINNNVLYKANTTTSTTWVDSEWDVIGTNFNTTSTYAQKIVTNVVAPYEMLLQVGDSNYCKPPIDVLKKTGGSDNVTLALENYNNASAYTGTSDFLKIENSKAKLYNYKEYSITQQTLSTIDIGVSDKIDFGDFVGSYGGIDDNSLIVLHFDGNLANYAVNGADFVLNSSYNQNAVYYNDGKFSTQSLWLSDNSNNAAVKCSDSGLVSAINSALATEYTIDFWFKVLDNSAWGDRANPIFVGDSGCYFFRFFGSSSKIDLYVDGAANVNGGNLVATLLPTMYNDGDWHHFAICCTTDNTYRVFLNGTLVNSSSIRGTRNIGSAIHVKCWPNDWQYQSAFVIDEFRFSNVARWTSDFTPPIQPYTRPNYNISSLGVI